MSNLEQEEVTTFIYDTLTKIDETEEDRLNVYSLKKFIANAIDYSCDWENETWTVYLVIFVFKLLGSILKKWEQTLTKKDELDKRVISRINVNILDIMDTLRNSNYLFGVVAEEDDSNKYKDEIFGMALYFLNKLMAVRTKSMQQKLEGIFKNNDGCQAFFKQINQYLKTFSSKINKNILRDFFSKQKYTDELSPKSYYIDKNLEKQIIDFMRFLSKNGNKFMQNYMKKQFNNTRSFNFVYMVNDISKEILSHLHYPVAFDIFISWLRWTLEFIQGPNKTNQTILINNDYVSNVSVQILEMKHHESEDIYGEMLDHNRSLSKGNSTTFKRSRFDNPSLSIGKSSIKKIGNAEITLPTTNYMISLAKYWMLLILNHLTDGHEPSDYIFYIYRREINPEIFRQNFAYQQYFFNKRYRSQYKKELFFTYHENINRKNRSPMIMEIGFEFYFLLKKMEENIKLDYDERYTKK